MHLTFFSSVFKTSWKWKKVDNKLSISWWLWRCDIVTIACICFKSAWLGLWIVCWILPKGCASIFVFTRIDFPRPFPNLSSRHKRTMVLQVFGPPLLMPKLSEMGWKILKASRCSILDSQVHWLGRHCNVVTLFIALTRSVPWPLYLFHPHFTRNLHTSARGGKRRSRYICVIFDSRHSSIRHSIGLKRW